MLKTGIFHPQLLRVLGEIRHKDLLVIADAGLPIPKGVERIDLGWKQGSPGYLEVLEEIAKVLVIESALFAEECHEASPDFHSLRTSCRSRHTSRCKCKQDRRSHRLR